MDAERDQVSTIQKSMIEAAAGACFSVSTCDHLRGLIRLAVEFFQYLQGSDEVLLDSEERSYTGGSIFGGVDSYLLVCSAYRSALGPVNSTLEWNAVASMHALKGEFVVTYRAFSDEAEFPRKCRLLLELFKLQMVFAAMTYE
jgi:hypothetical protein